MRNRNCSRSVAGWAFRNQVSIAFQSIALMSVVAFVGCAPGDAEPPRDVGTDRYAEAASQADSLIAAAVSAGVIPGAVLRVTRGGDVVVESAHGTAGPGREMTIETAFDLASITKVLATTFAVMILVDEGRIALDESVDHYLPDFSPRPPPLDDPSAGIGAHQPSITVQHLLTHTSGMAQWYPIYYHASDRNEAWDFIRDHPLHWPVGRERRYSDLGFMTLGRLVEEVSGLPLDQFVLERIYRPLQLSRIGYHVEGSVAATSRGNPFERRMVHDPDFGYLIHVDPDLWSGWRDRTLIGEVNDGNAFHAFQGVAGHAGLFGNAPAVSALLDALLDGFGDRPEGGLVSPETVRQFMEPSPHPNQLLGWQARDIGLANFTHTGFTGTFIMGVPSLDLGVVLLTNRQFGVDGSEGYPDLSALQDDLVRVLVVPGH